MKSNQKLRLEMEENTPVGLIKTRSIQRNSKDSKYESLFNNNSDYFYQK